MAGSCRTPSGFEAGGMDGPRPHLRTGERGAMDAPLDPVGALIVVMGAARERRLGLAGDRPRGGWLLPEIDLQAIAGAARGPPGTRITAHVEAAVVERRQVARHRNGALVEQP